MPLPTATRDPVRESEFQRQSFPFALPAVSATTTLALTTLPLRFRLDRAELIVDATYTQDPANYYVFTLQAGGTVLGTWSTLTGQQGTLTGGTPAAMVLATPDANLVNIAGNVLSLVCTKFGAAANATLRINVHGRHL